MNKGELISEISKSAKVTRKETAAVLEAWIETIEKAVARNKKVSLIGFGTFQLRKRAARTGRNPRTGEPLEIPARKVPAFSAGKVFKVTVNGK